MRIEEKMGLWTLSVLILLGPFLMTGPAVARESETGQVAKVNGVVITRGDLDREIFYVRQRLASQGKTLTETQMRAIQGDVLESLINRELLFQATQKKGITVEKAVVDKRVARLKEKFPDEAAFNGALKRMNLTETLVRSQIEKDLATQRFIEKQIAGKVIVSEEESRSYYDSHPEAFKEPERIKASHILIKVDPQVDVAQKAAAREKMEEISRRVKKGEDFAALAKAFSEGPSSSRGGDLGYFRRGQMVRPFEDAAFGLAPGQVSGIVETRFGYHLIKVFDKKPETTRTYHEVKDRLQGFLKNQKVQKEVKSYVEELKAQASVERFLPGAAR